MGLPQRQRDVPCIRERNYGCPITESVFRGLRCVTLENQLIRVSVVADKGADIYESLHKPTDTEFLRRTPLGLRRQPPGLSFRLSWQNKVFPYLWYWQVTRGAFGYPWYGTTDNLALEPHSSLFPMLQRAIEQRHTLKLEPSPSSQPSLKPRSHSQVNE